jgi:Asp-tRNA(Asn)/Glu-tRNA(Gln) amidotransferase A subunit family amidase
VQLIGRPFADDVVLAIAAAVERVFEQKLRPVAT